jgi:hypothetical protein
MINFKQVNALTLEATNTYFECVIQKVYGVGYVFATAFDQVEFATLDAAKIYAQGNMTIHGEA